jgi:hypothetical protein
VYSVVGAGRWNLDLQEVGSTTLSIALLEESKDQSQTLEKQAAAHDEEEHVCKKKKKNHRSAFQ